MATDPRTIINTNEDPGLVHPTGYVPTQSATNGTAEVKSVTINYTDPPLYGVPELQIFNDPGGRNGAVQFNVGNRLGGDSNFVWNSKNRTLSILGNIRISDSIIGKYNTNTKNLKISGGEDGYVLSTDGTGNLSWVAQTGGGTNYANSNVANYLPTYTGNVSANYFIGNGSQLTGLPTQYANSNVANYLPTYAGNLNGNNISITDTGYIYNISSTGLASLTTANVSSNLTTNAIYTDNYFYANGDPLNVGANTGNLEIIGTAITIANGASQTIIDISPNGEGWAFLQIPENSIANNTNVRLHNDAGNIELQTGNAGAGNATVYKTWLFRADGSLKFPDDSEQTTAYPGYQAPITVSDNAPNSAVEGDVWFDSQAGRSYVKYNDQWVDMSPQTVNDTDIQANSITFEDGTVQTTAYTGSNASIDKLVNGNYEVTLENDGTLTVPGLIHLQYANSEVGYIDTNNHGVALSGSFGSSIAINTDGPIGQKNWEFNPEGNIRFPDGSEQNTAYTGQTVDSTILVSDNVPSSAPEGTLWFNSDEGRTYVKYSNTWVDSSPQTIDPTPLRPNENNDVEFPNDAIFLEGRIYQDASAGTTSMRWVNINNNQNTEMLRAYTDAIGEGNDERGQLGVSFQSPNVSGLYITSFDGDNENKWTFEGTGNLRFPDDTIQTTAYQPATLLDGGGANANYASNIPPGGINNPFDQNLSTSDSVTFLNVTANNFNGTATLASSVINVPIGNVTGLGNISSTNLDGNASNVLYGNGVFATLTGGTANTGNIGFLNTDIYSLNGIILENADLTHGATSALIIPSNGSTSAVQLNNFYGDITLTTSNSGAGGLKTWRFGGDGNITSPSTKATISDNGEFRLWATDTDITVYRNGQDGYGVKSGAVEVFANNSKITQTTSSGLQVLVGNITASNIIANIAVANVVGLGNIATINLDANASNILYGNGVFASVPLTYSNTNVAAYLPTYTGNITANYFSGNGSLITFITGSNVSGNVTSAVQSHYSNIANSVTGQVSNALISGTVYTNAQPNITSVGTLTSLSVTGNASAGNAILTGTSVTGINAVLAGPTFTPLANTMGGFVSNVNSYTQLTIQNKSTGADATTDFIATADNGSDTVNYLDLGIINSGYDNGTPTNSLGNIVYAADSYIYAQGNTSATGQSGGNLAIGTTVASKTVKIFAGGVTSNSIVASFANTGANITGSLNVSGNITGANISGNISITGNIQGTSSNVSLVAGSYTMTFDNTGILTLPRMGGDEGGEINLGIPATNTTLTSRVVVDVFQDRLRFFDGSTKGAYIDLSQATTGVGTLLNNRVSGLVNAGTFVTMDLIKATVTTSGQRGLSLATTTGTFACNIGGTYATTTPSTGGSAGTLTITTTASSSIFNWSFPNQGDTSTYILTDTTNSRAYRITLQIGSSYNNNMISIERLI